MTATGTSTFNGRVFGTEQVVIDRGASNRPAIILGEQALPGGLDDQLQINAHGGTDQFGMGINLCDNANSPQFIEFSTGDPAGTTTIRGSISYNSNNDNVVYNTTSDARLKTDLEPIENALGTINKIHTYCGRFIGARDKQHFFIAQDLQVAGMASIVTTNKFTDEEYLQVCLLYTSPSPRDS